MGRFAIFISSYMRCLTSGRERGWKKHNLFLARHGIYTYTQDRRRFLLASGSIQDSHVIPDGAYSEAAT
jgi:hypothetical protein